VTTVECAPFYRIDFAVDDADALQRALNGLYRYEDDVVTKVLHRSRLNLVHVLTRELAASGVIRRRDSAVDIGCNAGAYCKMLSDAGFRHVLGIDLDARAIRMAEARFGHANGHGSIRFEVQDAERLDTTRRYDLVLCTEVVEHTAHPERVVEQIKRAIAPGGVAVVSMPNRMSLPYLVIYVFHRLRWRRLDPSVAAHLGYPFYRTLRLFSDGRTTIVRTDGANLLFDPLTVRVVSRLPGFTVLNRLNFRLARLWPLKYFAQFFFVVLKRSDA
jgi:2-polyprenyl-3-methyl-5-hydroxy-6-metoxy-1,4-benzoquinol methylase